MDDAAGATTFLFTDIEGSTRLWEREPERMRAALARHDAIARAAVEDHGGQIVKTTGDGLHAAFADPLDAVLAAARLQTALAASHAGTEVVLHVRCGLHAGIAQRRDNDYYGADVNRAARVMSVAHGGQVLLSNAVARGVAGRLPAGVVLRDLGTVRLRDLARPERLFQVVQPGLRVDFPALRSLEATPNNLPHALSSFVGRERERAELAARLRETRLVTILGVGGLGKSRLALHAAADLLDEFPDGAWRVELGPVGEATRVSQAVASALGVVAEPGRPVEESLARYVRDRELLLILDNCEHLLEAAAAAAATLLAEGGRVRILATSREPLRIAGESSFFLPPLAVPGPREAVEPWAAARFEAVRLFAERAAAAQPAFRLDDANVTLIAAICARLDGLPLAIELAGARVRSLTLQQIALRLDDRFHLFGGGDPTASPRQRTLRAMIDWSHDLLPAEERAVFRRLSVFAGGCTLEAAEAVCAAGAIARAAVLELLARLVEKSLVTFDAADERYGLLETLREYAHDKLVESREGEATCDRHFSFYLALAEQAKPALTGPEQAAWLSRLDRERENLLLAHARAGSGGRGPEPGLRLTNGIKLYWINRGLLAMGHRVACEALARVRSGEPSFLLCRGLYEVGQLASCMGRFGEARRGLEQSLAIARELGNERAVAIVLQPLGIAALGEGDTQAAQGYLEEAYARASQGGAAREIAAAALELGRIHRVRGDHERARVLCEQALQLARELGDRDAIGIALLDRAMGMAIEGDAAGAREAVTQALGIAEEIGSQRLTQHALEVAAALAARESEWPRAARLAGAADALASRTGLRREPADESFLAPLLESARKALDSRFDELARDGARLATPAAIQEAREGLTSR